MDQTTNSNNVFFPNGTITGGFTDQSQQAGYQGQQPSVCPGCGRCNCCGRPYAQPYSPFTNPYPYPQITYTSGQNTATGLNKGVVAVNSCQLDSSSNPQEDR